MTTSSTGAIVLAAGRSTRMGAHKLLLPLGDRPVVAHVVAAVLHAPVHPVVVVLGHDAHAVRAALPRDLPAGDLIIVENTQYRLGMATSLRAGLAALPADAIGALIVLGDQPLVHSSHLAQIAQVAEQTHAAVVAASYDGRRGHPVYFSQSCFAELQQVAGDEGGRTIIERHQDELVVVPLDDAAAVLDVDVPADYQRVLEIWAQRHRA